MTHERHIDRITFTFGSQTLNDILDRAIDFAHQQLAEVDNDFSSLPVELQTVIRVEAVQAIIDNGGLHYFYEYDFPGQPPYTVFVEDFLRIEAFEQAEHLRRSVESFPFANPHLDKLRRSQRLSEMEDEDASDSVLTKSELALCGNERTWELLRKYVEAHRSKFDLET